jgi:hypothetical protein
VAPVTNAAPQVGGRPKISSSQRRVMASRYTVAGEMACKALFWSQAPASQLAASPTGSEPPMTKPK